MPVSSAARLWERLVQGRGVLLGLFNMATPHLLHTPSWFPAACAGVLVVGCLVAAAVQQVFDNLALVVFLATGRSVGRAQGQAGAVPRWSSEDSLL